MRVGQTYWMLLEDGPQDALRVEAFQAVHIGPYSVYGVRPGAAAGRTMAQGLSGTVPHPRSEVYWNEAEALRWAVRGLDLWLARPWPAGRTVAVELRRQRYQEALQRVLSTRKV